ncbi:glutamic acid-rich protein-like [Anopheles maculipalpis]|uniref:glutamic acid-rich protein-like n=1 Tax=Anopheles maculipalpis TaxID=1496333 RepID=UPI002159B5C6|nr:glutamic acid-rich protein-like [Anopheles maculipalpis]
MCRAENFILVAVLLVECSGLHMYPEIFDPAKFLQRPLPLKSVESRTSSEPEYHSGGGFKDGEVGFVRSTSESGKGGYRHKENFHKKDGNKYGHERQTGFGESKHTENDQAKEHERLTVDTHHYRPEPTYEVIEEHASDVENPDKNKKYGGLASSNKNKKKPTDEKPTKSAKSSRQMTPAKKGSNQKKNHNGYESIVYHENERDSTEHGYGKKKAVGKIPEAEKPAKQIAHDDGDAFEEDRLESAERQTAGDDHGHEYDSESEAEAERESDFNENYDALRFEADFDRSFADGEDHHGDDGEKDGRQAAKNDEDYDYADDDRDEEDDSADEDKYRGDDESGEEEEGEGSEKAGEDRQYEYASEADGDAQDY